MPRSAEQKEELANALSHGVGGLLGLAAWPALAATADRPMAGPVQIGSAVFALTMLLMFVASTVYHAAPAGPTRIRLQRLDHAAIFLFIAGSCTPFAIGNGSHPETWPMMAAVWLIALVGIGMKLGRRLRSPLSSTALYLAFGWLAGAAALPMLDQLPPVSATLLVAGGLAYTLGSGFYLMGRRVRYAHLAWHVMVLVGAGCHLLAVSQRGF